MKYLLLIYEAKATEELVKDIPDLFQQYGTFTQSVKDSGHYRGGEALRSFTTATTVRVRDGKVLTTDGPFAETREHLAGFYTIEADNLDDALAIAARIPGARSGSVEVRPVLSH